VSRCVYTYCANTYTRVSVRLLYLYIIYVYNSYSYTTVVGTHTHTHTFTYMCYGRRLFIFPFRFLRAERHAAGVQTFTRLYRRQDGEDYAAIQPHKSRCKRRTPPLSLRTILYILSVPFCFGRKPNRTRLLHSNGRANPFQSICRPRGSSIK